jgi:hypothetical protein
LGSLAFDKTPIFFPKEEKKKKTYVDLCVVGTARGDGHGETRYDITREIKIRGWLRNIWRRNTMRYGLTGFDKSSVDVSSLRVDNFDRKNVFPRIWK